MATFNKWKDSTIYGKFQVSDFPNGTQAYAVFDRNVTVSGDISCNTLHLNGNDLTTKLATYQPLLLPTSNIIVGNINAGIFTSNSIYSHSYISIVPPDNGSIATLNFINYSDNQVACSFNMDTYSGGNLSFDLNTTYLPNGYSFNVNGVQKLQITNTGVNVSSVNATGNISGNTVHAATSITTKTFNVGDRINLYSGTGSIGAIVFSKDSTLAETTGSFYTSINSKRMIFDIQPYLVNGWSYRLQGNEVVGITTAGDITCNSLSTKSMTNIVVNKNITSSTNANSLNYNTVVTDGVSFTQRNSLIFNDSSTSQNNYNSLILQSNTIVNIDYTNTISTFGYGANNLYPSFGSNQGYIFLQSQDNSNLVDNYIAVSSAGTIFGSSNSGTASVSFLGVNGTTTISNNTLTTGAITTSTLNSTSANGITSTNATITNLGFTSLTSTATAVAGKGLNYTVSQISATTSSTTLTYINIYTYCWCVPTLNKTVILPSGTITGQWISITNRATGAFNLTIQYPSATTIGIITGSNTYSSGKAVRYMWDVALNTWFVVS